MLDEQKIKSLKRLGLIGGAFILMLASYGVGSIGKNQQKSEATPKQTQEQKETSLTQEVVKDFLVAYYTKKELEENRNRYEPLMTANLYNQEVDAENQPIAQAYKGYMVDFQYKDAEIYIDEENLAALVKVKYENTILAKKGSYEDSQTVTNEASFQLYFIKQGDSYLVNQKTPYTIASSYEEGSSYPDYGQVSVSEEKEENDEQETEPESSGTESDQD